MKELNKFMKFRPYFVLTLDSVIDGREPQEILINEGAILFKDYEAIEIQKKNPYTERPEKIEIKPPTGYMRFITTSPAIPVFFAKPTNCGIYPSLKNSYTNDLDAE